MVGELLSEIAVPNEMAHWRRFALDGALLLFDRDTGFNALCEGEATAHLRQRAPRMVQFGLTNSCNLSCAFCSRDVNAKSEWTASEVVGILSGLADRGVLEVAFGGGEPWLFPNFSDLICRLYDTTPLAVNVTTNGVALTEQGLARIRGKYGQLRLSLYDDNGWRQRVSMLSAEGARFGVNLLVTPSRLRELESTVLELCRLGCSDVLLLSYNGYDLSMHLSSAETEDLASRVSILARALSRRCLLKLGVCWGEQMQSIPRLFHKGDCGAGKDFIVLTSERKVQPCSFHQLAISVRTADDIMTIWANEQSELGRAAVLPGCARVTITGGYGAC